MTAKEFQAQYGRGQPSTAAPAKGTPTKAPSKPSPANELTKAAIQLLRMYGVHIWRQNNGAVYDASFGGYRAGSVTPGIADTIGYFKATGRCSRAAGRFAAVEIKVGRDVLSPEQIEFLAGVKAAGGFACECRSIDQLQTELKAYLATLP